MQKGIIKNVNKLTGDPIDAKDLASMLSGIIGNESGVLTVFDELRLEKISDNKVRLHSGVYSLKGHILYIPKGSYEDFEIESGTLGANRIDLLVAEYVKNGEGDGEDTLRFRVIKGEATSGTPEEPTLIQQDINENGIIAQECIYEMFLSGTKLNVKEKNKKIINVYKLNAELDDYSQKTTKKINHIESLFGDVEIYSGYWEGGIGYPKPIPHEKVPTRGIIHFIWTVMDKDYKFRRKGETTFAYTDINATKVYEKSVQLDVGYELFMGFANNKRTPQFNKDYMAWTRINYIAFVSCGGKIDL